MARVPRKNPSAVSAPPQLALGVALLGLAAVMAAGGALLLHYTRRASTPNDVRNIEVEIPAPRIEPVNP
jgi:hypothetical protein